VVALCLERGIPDRVFPEAVRELRFGKWRACNGSGMYSPAYLKNEAEEVVRLQLLFKSCRVLEVEDAGNAATRVTLTATEDQLDELDRMEEGVLDRMGQNRNTAEAVAEGKTRLTSSYDRVCEQEDGSRNTIADFVVYPGKSSEMSKMLKKLNREIDGDRRVDATLQLIGPMSFEEDEQELRRGKGMFLAWKLVAYEPKEGDEVDGDSRYYGSEEDDGERSSTACDDEEDEEEEEEEDEGDADDDDAGEDEKVVADDAERVEDRGEQKRTSEGGGAEKKQQPTWKEFSPAVREQMERVRHVHTELVRQFAEVQAVQLGLTDDLKELMKWSEELARMKNEKTVDPEVLGNASDAIGRLINLSPRVQEKEKKDSA